MNAELRYECRIKKFLYTKDSAIINDADYERMLSQIVGNIDNFLMMINEEAKRFTNLFRVDCT